MRMKKNAYRAKEIKSVDIKVARECVRGQRVVVATDVADTLHVVAVTKAAEALQKELLALKTVVHAVKVEAKDLVDLKADSEVMARQEAKLHVVLKVEYAEPAVRGGASGPRTGSASIPARN